MLGNLKLALLGLDQLHEELNSDPNVTASITIKRSPTEALIHEQIVPTSNEAMPVLYWSADEPAAESVKVPEGFARLVAYGKISLQLWRNWPLLETLYIDHPWSCYAE